MTVGRPSVKMTFRVAPGARIRKDDVEVLGKTFEHLKHSGPLTAERVLAEATNARSPMHRFFEWDDDKAAHQFRLEQARRLIRSIDVVIEDAKGKQVNMRAYYSVRDAEGQRGYEPMSFVFETPSLADQVIQQAQDQLEAWNTKYKKYQWARGAVPHIAAALRAMKASAKKTKAASKKAA
jgi:hypothetical protein